MPLAGAQGIHIDHELDTSSELTSLPTSQANSPLRSTTSTLTPLSGRGLSTSSSRLTSLSSLSPDVGLSSSRKSTPSQSVSTGRQTNEIISVSSRQGSSLSVAPSQVRRSARVSSSLVPSNRLASIKGKEKALVTPASTPASLRTPATGEVTVKKEEVEPRVLRIRPSAPSLLDSAKEAPSKKELPRGPDGKLLPTCATCSNVLPVISVDHKVVWGLGPESKKGKKQKQDCPRLVDLFRSKSPGTHGMFQLHASFCNLSTGVAHSQSTSWSLNLILSQGPYPGRPRIKVIEEGSQISEASSGGDGHSQKATARGTG